MNTQRKRGDDSSLVQVEACIRGDLAQEAGLFASAAFRGGAARIELCRSMHLDGLTPPQESIESARMAFQKAGLMVMIRPRGGDFFYSEDEIGEMLGQISRAAKAGADGVVFGTLTDDGKIDERQARRLIELSHSLTMETTFHRAFDAATEPAEALDSLIGLGIDRILTSGVPWSEAGSALDGLESLNERIQQCGGRAEIVIGGGISPKNAPLILNALQPWKGALSVHAYSGVMESGETTEGGVRSLVESVMV